ncbi:MAG: M23 family metallopeptidase [Eudoraea sp.]|nr:M23 family metallopeptidase [Eudoraea sp.]
MKFVLNILSFLLVSAIYGQFEYPQNTFRSPLDIPLILSGTFGELRSNHFHAGIDIKTQKRTGLPIYAIADGTVSRIKISHWGYGKALYVAHPNGYTSVYAHLKKFSPEIEAYIKKIQYERKSFEVEVFPDYGELNVIKDEVMAYSGNTGGSSGPHLHFEIRSSITEKPTNPLLYGIEVKDATDPTISGLYAYPLSPSAQVNQQQTKVKIPITRQKDGTYRANTVLAHSTIGFGINAYDRQDLATNRNGLFAVEQKVNGQVISQYDFETFSFSETRYINTFIDYDHFGRHRQRIQLFFRSEGNELGIYNTLVNNGKLKIEEGRSYDVEVLLTDIKGNETKLVIPVEGRKSQLAQIDKGAPSGQFIKASKPNNFDLEGARVYFPANTFYNDFYANLLPGKDTVTIHNNRTPAHKNYTLTFDTSGYADADRKKMFIARLDRKGKPGFMKTYKRGNTFTTRTRSLGTFTLAKDTLAPSIRAKNFKDKQWLTNYHYLSLRISDDLSGINSYSATLNGQWILMEYEPKTKTITYNFDDKILNTTQCDLRVEVTDNVGNTSLFRSTFFRK